MKTADDLRKVLEARRSDILRQHADRARELVEELEKAVAEKGNTKIVMKHQDKEVYGILRSHGFTVKEAVHEPDQTYGTRMGTGYLSFEP